MPYDTSRSKDRPGTGANADQAAYDGSLPRPSADGHAPLSSGVATGLALLEDAVGKIGAAIDEAGPEESAHLAELLAPLARALDAAVSRAAGQAAVAIDGERHEHSTPAKWLAAATRVDPGVARAMLADHRFLADYPHLQVARRHGGVSWQHVGVIRRIVSVYPWRIAAFASVEEQFATFACTAAPAALRQVLATWAESVDDLQGAQLPDRAWSERSLDLFEVRDGWVLRGGLSRTDGALLAGVLHEIVNAIDRSSGALGVGASDAGPSATSKRADALVQLARWATDQRLPILREGDPDTCGQLLSSEASLRARPLVVIPSHHLAPHQLPSSLLNMADSGSAPDGRPESAPCRPQSVGTSPVSEIDAALAAVSIPGPVRWYAGVHRGTLNDRDTQLLLCDSAIARLITTPDGLPLDLGRQARVVSSGLRTALIARDGGCVIPGCPTSSAWCDAHHIVPWTEGGSTTPANLSLVCGAHHRALHCGHWTISAENGIPIARPTPRRE